MSAKPKDYVVEHVPVGALKPHPRNYRQHPEDQLRHIAKSIEEHGFYRNVVVARDNTILAGHGVVLATEKMGLKTVPVIRLDIAASSPRALKVLASDNEIAKLAAVDDRALTELLKEITGKDPAGLLGTGFNEEQLAALTLVTRPASEIASIDEAKEWVGMPEYDEGSTPIRLVISFKTEKDRDAYVKKTKLRIDTSKGTTWSTRWPWTDQEERAHLRFEEDGAPPP
jgi:ParB-like chromosome segregation protein Spo0J